MPQTAVGLAPDVFCDAIAIYFMDESVEYLQSGAVKSFSSFPPLLDIMLQNPVPEFH